MRSRRTRGSATTSAYLHARPGDSSARFLAVAADQNATRNAKAAPLGGVLRQASRSEQFPQTRTQFAPLSPRGSDQHFNINELRWRRDTSAAPRSKLRRETGKKYVSTEHRC